VVTLLFVNYRADDSAWAVLVDQELSRRFGTDQVFRASRSIPPGADFPDWILGHLHRSSALVAVIGPTWSSVTGRDGAPRLHEPDDWVRREIAEAFTMGIPVIPVLVDDTARLDGADLPDDIARLARCQYLRLSYRNVAYDMARLVDEVAALVPSLGDPAPADPAPAAPAPAAPAPAAPTRSRRRIGTAVAVTAAVAGVVIVAALASRGSPETKVLFDDEVELRQGDYVRLEDGLVSGDVSGSDLSFDHFGGDWNVHPAERATIAEPNDRAADRDECGELLERRRDDLISLRLHDPGSAFCIRTNQGHLALAELRAFSDPADPPTLTLRITVWP
jgi:hypothetical protein